MQENKLVNLQLILGVLYLFSVSNSIINYAFGIINTLNHNIY